jgi:hypothetical protein
MMTGRLFFDENGFCEDFGLLCFSLRLSRRPLRLKASGLVGALGLHGDSSPQPALSGVEGDVRASWLGKLYSEFRLSLPSIFALYA